MANPWQCREFRFGCYAVVFALGMLVAVHAFTSRPESDFSTDGPYHVTMADLLSELALRKTFPATQKSIWRDHFYDKELGFHFLLRSVRRWGGLLGYDGASPPFLLETAVLVLLWIGVFYWALVRLDVRHAYIFVPAVLLFCPLFTDRLNLVRPHVLSIMLMLVTAVGVCRWRGWRQAVGLFALGFVFAYTHSNPHFVLLPTGCYALLRLRAARCRALLAPLAALGGVLAGLTLHPQFPNTFIIWKIQCIDVVWQALTGRIPELTTPAELRAPSGQTYVVNAALFLFPLFGLWAAWRWRKWRVMTFAERYFLSLSVLSCIGFLLCRRMIEYALPFSVLAAALIYGACFAPRSARWHAGVFLAVLVFCGALAPVHVWEFRSSRVAVPRQFADWARAHLPAGTYIANLHWDDFPLPFFCAPEFRYAYAMDPMFAYMLDPESYLQVERLCAGRMPFPSALELQRLLGTRFVFVSCMHAATARRMAQAKYALAYQGIDAWVFDLAAPPVDHGLSVPDPATASSGRGEPAVVSVWRERAGAGR